MGTRGFIGIKNKGKITGYYNHYDSYYESLGRQILEFYYNGNSIIGALDEERQRINKDSKFLRDGLYCEYGYVYNKNDDTLEVYRGFFKQKQLLEKSDTDYYVHLVFVIDRKIHSKELALKAFDAYSLDSEDKRYYPERSVINVCTGCWKPIEVDKRYHDKKCENKAIIGDI